MSLMDVIDSLASDYDVVVTRRSKGAFDDETGAWILGTPGTFILPTASIQPATGMARVVGGRDMRSDEQGQHVDDLRAVYSNVRLITRDKSHEPDTIFFDDDDWVAVRDETYTLNDETVYRTLITRESRGSS